MTMPPPGSPAEIAPGLRLVLAANPSPMTGPGTNSYLVGAGAVTVIDPGPDDPAHLAALLAALGPGDRIARIVVTHSHRDHSALAPKLRAGTGAPVLAFGDSTAGRRRTPPLAGDLTGGEGVDSGFVPDRRLADGARVPAGGMAPLTALHMPGHMGNHLCLAWGAAVFTGDLVMGWASSLVSPPDGDMRAYMASLDRLAARRSGVLYPGHGPPVHEPAARIAALAAHRRAREAQILAALADGAATIPALAGVVYADTPGALRGAAERNLVSHLLDLLDRGSVRAATPIHRETVFTRP